MGLPSNITKIYHCCISFSWSLVWIFTESCILNLGSYYFFHSLWIRPLKWVSRLKVWIWLAVVNIENSQHFQLLTKIFSDWLLQFLIIICSIFVQSSDWLMWFLIIICSIFVQSSDWLLRFLIIICCNFKILHDLEIEKLNFGSLKINENNFAWHLIWYYISSKQSWLQASNWQNNLQKIQIKFLHLWHHQGCVIIFFVLGRNWNWVDQYFCLKWQTNALCYLKTEVS